MYIVDQTVEGVNEGHCFSRQSVGREVDGAVDVKKQCGRRTLGVSGRHLGDIWGEYLCDILCDNQGLTAPDYNAETGLAVMTGESEVGS